MSLGYAPGYDEKELEELEEAVVPLSRDLAGRIKDIVLPRRGYSGCDDEIRSQCPKTCKKTSILLLS
jgi:hypothetical protein